MHTPEPIRELRPHATWRGVELIWALVEGTVVAALLAVWQYFKSHLDLLSILLIFVGSVLVLLVGSFRRSKRATPPDLPTQKKGDAVPDLDNARLADANRQILSLSHFERFALWQLLLKDGMTAEQFRDLARHEHGIPVATQADVLELGKIFAVIHEKSALLAYEQSLGRWTIKPEFKAPVHHALGRMSPIFGI